MSQNPQSVSMKQQRIAQLAQQSPQMGLTSLAYHMDLQWLSEAYRRTRKDGAAGVDGQTAADYEQDLEGNLRSLLERAKSGRYSAPPVRRVHIPKAGSPGQTRPIGIPTLEDKVLQRAVSMLLEPIYEQDFYDGSYGFRPGRGAHQALEQLRNQMMDTHGGWILEVDISKFLETARYIKKLPFKWMALPYDSELRWKVVDAGSVWWRLSIPSTMPICGNWSSVGCATEFCCD